MEADGHADEHHDAGDHVEKALSSLSLKRPSVWGGRCNSGTHRLSAAFILIRQEAHTEIRTRSIGCQSGVELILGSSLWAHVVICAGRPWHYVRSTPSGSAIQKLSHCKLSSYKIVIARTVRLSVAALANRTACKVGFSVTGRPVPAVRAIDYVSLEATTTPVPLNSSSTARQALTHCDSF